MPVILGTLALAAGGGYYYYAYYSQGKLAPTRDDDVRAKADELARAARLRAERGVEDVKVSSSWRTVMGDADDNVNVL